LSSLLRGTSHEKGSRGYILPWALAPKDHKIEHNSDHVTKFHGDRSGELGDPRGEQKKKDTSAVKHKTSRF